MVRHPGDAQLLAEHAPGPARGLPDGVDEVVLVPLAVGPANGLHVVAVPVQAHEAGREQLVAQRVFARRRDGVVDEEGVADGTVDDAVEDVS